MQEITCEQTPVAKLDTATICHQLKYIHLIQINDTDGYTTEEAREMIRKRLELELRIRNMGLR